jgi:hypothetical protein
MQPFKGITLLSLLYSFCKNPNLNSRSMVSDSSSSSPPAIDTHNDFKPQHLLAHPESEISTFSDLEVSRLLASGAFLATASIRAHDAQVRSDFISTTLVCFLAYPFTIGFKYPFPPFISKFFETTGLSYAQAMPVVWRISHILNHLVEDLGLDIRISDLATKGVTP